MPKKATALVTLASFCVFATSCYPTRTENVNTFQEAQKTKDLILLAVAKTSGESLRFPGGRPAWVARDALCYVRTTPMEIDRANVQSMKRAFDSRILQIATKDGKTYEIASAVSEKDRIKATVYELFSVQIDRANIQSIRRGGYQRIIQIETKDGLVYRVASAKEQKDRISISAHVADSIPLPEIEAIEFKRAKDPGVTFLATLGAVVLGICLAIYIGLGIAWGDEPW